MMTELLSIKNPSNQKYEIKIIVPELTFLGVKNQPDFGVLEVLMNPSEKVIELKSFKYYIYEFRNKLMSYERIINVIYDDIMAEYKPHRLVVTMTCNPRGGITSVLKIDSEWRK